MYKDAVKQGHTAIFAYEDKLSEDIIHLCLGNFPQGKSNKCVLDNFL